MDGTALITIAAFALVFGLFSRRLESSVLSPTMLFSLAGLALGPAVLGIVEVDEHWLHTIGEWTLIILLFGDASRIDLSALRREAGLPVRLLGIGMPLTIALGAGLALVLFPEFGVWDAALLAAILAPTDAALGQAVVSASVVPKRIRQALNVESGLNDGIAVPFVMIFAALTATTSQQDAVGWAGFAAQQIGVGVLAGLLAGGGGGSLVKRFDAAGRISPAYERIAAVAIAVLAVGLAEAGGGNPFIAAFVAGLALGNVAKSYSECVHEFIEAEGQLLMLVVFLLVGASIVWPAIQGADGATVLYALASLTVVRMVPVALSLLGTGADRRTILFLGWFGPRGLATVLFGLLIAAELDVAHGEEIVAVAMCAVVASIILHGVTAAWGARAYGRAMADQSDAMEHETVSDHRVRVRMQP